MERATLRKSVKRCRGGTIALSRRQGKIEFRPKRGAGARNSAPNNRITHTLRPGVVESGASQWNFRLACLEWPIQRLYIAQKAYAFDKDGCKFRAAPELALSRHVVRFCVSNYPKINMSFGIMRVELKDFAKFLYCDFVLPVFLGALVMFLNCLSDRGLGRQGDRETSQEKEPPPFPQTLSHQILHPSKLRSACRQRGRRDCRAFQRGKAPRAIRLNL